MNYNEIKSYARILNSIDRIFCRKRFAYFGIQLIYATEVTCVHKLTNVYAKPAFTSVVFIRRITRLKNAKHKNHIFCLKCIYLILFWSFRKLQERKEVCFKRQICDSLITCLVISCKMVGCVSRIPC